MPRLLTVIAGLLALSSSATSQAESPIVCEPLPPPAPADYDGPLFPFLTKVTSELPEPTTEMGKAFGYTESELHRWGYLSVDGKTVLPPIYHHAWPFSGDQAVVQVLERRESTNSIKVLQSYGVIDRSGAFTAEARFNKIEPFSEGLARAILPSPMFVEPDDTTLYRGYIDATGTMAFASEMDKEGKYAGDFSEGLAWFHPPIAMTQARQWLTPKDLEIFTSFGMSDEDAVVRSDSTPKGFIDRTGAIAIDPKFKQVHPFTQGLAAVQIYADEQWGFITPKGAWAIEAQYAWVRPFSEDLAVFTNDLKTCGYLNRKGKVVIPATFSRCELFSEGVAVVRVDGAFQVINRKGKVLPLLDQLPEGEIASVGAMTEGLLPVRMTVDDKKKWGFVDRKGALVIPFTFTSWEAPVFSNGLALATIHVEEPSTQEWNKGKIVDVKKQGYIDRTGKWVYGPLAGPWMSW